MHECTEAVKGLQTSDFGLRTSEFGLRTSDFGLRTSDFRLQTSEFRIRDNAQATWSHGELMMEEEVIQPFYKIFVHM
jgi:hypothetical protein